MQPRQLLDRISTPDGRELALYQRGGDFFIEIDGDELMTSRMHGSEEELARLGLAALGPRPKQPLRVLVGGLGMGFTLRAVLAEATRARLAGVKAVVSEFFPAVVEWNRRWLGPLAGHPLADPRTEIAVGDIAPHLAASPGRYDLILLDIDNSPSAFTLDANRHLYLERGLATIHAALTPGGVLAVWSAEEDALFVRRLRRSGFTAEVHRVAARAEKRGGRHLIFLARRTGR